MASPYNEGLMRQLCKELLGKDARDSQIAAARSLYEGKHTYLIAPTAAGKSLLIHFPLLYPSIKIHAMIIIITPLKAFQKQQADHRADVPL
jgi:superfamily II DNA helicase RecQ